MTTVLVLHSIALGILYRSQTPSIKFTKPLHKVYFKKPVVLFQIELRDFADHATSLCYYHMYGDDGFNDLLYIVLG